MRVQGFKYSSVGTRLKLTVLPAGKRRIRATKIGFRDNRVNWGVSKEGGGG